MRSRSTRPVRTTFQDRQPRIARSDRRNAKCIPDKDLGAWRGVAHRLPTPPGRARTSRRGWAVQRWMTAALGPVLVALASAVFAFAETDARRRRVDVTAHGDPRAQSSGQRRVRDPQRRSPGVVVGGVRAGHGPARPALGQLQLPGGRALRHRESDAAASPGTYRLSGWIRTEGVGSGTSSGVRLQFDFRPAVHDWKTTDVISGTRDWTLFQLPNLVVTQDATVTIKLENYNNTTGTAWFDDVQLQREQPQAVEAFMLYPNFRGMLFDDQSPTLKFDVTVTPPGGDFGRYRVAGTLRDEATGQVLVSQHYPATANLVAELEGGAMQMGRPYLATFSAHRRRQQRHGLELSGLPGLAGVRGGAAVDEHLVRRQEPGAGAGHAPLRARGLRLRVRLRRRGRILGEPAVVADRRAAAARDEHQLLPELLVRRGARRRDDGAHDQSAEARRHVPADR